MQLDLLYPLNNNSFMFLDSLFDIYAAIRTNIMEFNRRYYERGFDTVSSYKKEYKGFFGVDVKLTKEEAINNLKEVLSEHQFLRDISNFDLVRVNISLVQLFNMEMAELDKRKGFLGSKEAVEYLFMILYRILSTDMSLALLNEAMTSLSYHLPSGHNYLDVYDTIKNDPNYVNSIYRSMFTNFVDPIAMCIRKEYNLNESDII